jgi:hypothetical protein
MAIKLFFRHGKLALGTAAYDWRLQQRFPVFYAEESRYGKRCNEEMVWVCAGVGMVIFAVAAFSSTHVAKKRPAFQGLEMHSRSSHIRTSGCSTEVRDLRYRLLL